MLKPKVSPPASELGNLYKGQFRFHTRFIDPFLKDNQLGFIVIEEKEGELGLLPIIAFNESGKKVLDILDKTTKEKTIWWLKKDMVQKILILA